MSMGNKIQVVLMVVLSIAFFYGGFWYAEVCDKSLWYAFPNSVVITLLSGFFAAVAMVKLL